jgi:hypothetical protein
MRSRELVTQASETRANDKPPSNIAAMPWIRSREKNTIDKLVGTSRPSTSPRLLHLSAGSTGARRLYRFPGWQGDRPDIDNPVVHLAIGLRATRSIFPGIRLSNLEPRSGNSLPLRQHYPRKLLTPSRVPIR